MYPDYAVIIKLDKESKEFQRAAFVNAVRKMYNTFTFSDQEVKNDVPLLMNEYMSIMCSINITSSQMSLLMST